MRWVGRRTTSIAATTSSARTSAFSGNDLYVVVSRRSEKIAAGTILKATMPVAGKAMFSHA